MPGRGLCIEQALIADAQAVVNHLREHRLSLVTAESCTAGLIAAALSHARGAGECLHGGFIVYSRAHKTGVLGVSQRALAERGAVSREVAGEMAAGALARSPADIALSVTGVLGPEPDEDGHAPGLVCFGLGRRGDEPLITAVQFDSDDPDEVRRCVVLQAFDLLQRRTGH